MSTRTRITLAAVGVLACSLPIASAIAAPSTPSGPLTIAVYGDSPYGRTAYAPGGQAGDTAELQKTPAFISTINGDPDVSEVFHVGDIHSGKDFCTQDWDNQIAADWQGYSKPLVYTPGDNEWSDCHKASSVTAPGEGGGFYKNGIVNYIGSAGVTTDQTQCVDYACGNPLANLALIRQLFFAHPGQTLGSGTLSVTSQADAFDPAHPADAQFVENVMWEQRNTVFVTVNLPGGSNNDADPWYKTPTASQAQLDEASARTGADVRWLDAAFGLANANKARGVVILEQADMWDGSAKQTNYDPIINDLATNAGAFKGSVLLFNGDSHLYRSDNPFVAGSACDGEVDPSTGKSVCAVDAASVHPELTLNVPNIHRVTVHGSTQPLEWLKLTVDPNANFKTTSTTFGPFSWSRQTQSQL